MNTKYILYGGHAPGESNSKEFYEEMARDITKKDITILYVPFSKPSKEYQQEVYEMNKKDCSNALPQKHITFLFAEEHPEKFLDQIHTSDVIFFGGGNDELLKKFLQQIPLDILIQHLEGKVIAGSSAGVNVLARYYYTNDRQQIEEGLGILPIKTFCHYTPEKEDLLVDLEHYKEHLTSFALPENEFVVIK